MLMNYLNEKNTTEDFNSSGASRLVYRGIGRKDEGVKMYKEHVVLGDPVDIEHMVKVSEKERILKHKRRVQESLLILTTYTAYHSRSIRRIQDFEELKDHFLTLKNTSYPHQRYVVYNTLVNEEEHVGFTQYTVSIMKIRRIRALTSSKTSMTRRPQYSISK
ncbi:hypothetical protein Tco_0841301 [Tanacetum coccineum]|uniref:Uncharacterized protein n=1 Tax=Tanacetum coccineum TaxID=301880 RepID=A0ABQ5B0D4_9ASTR